MEHKTCKENIETNLQRKCHLQVGSFLAQVKVTVWQMYMCTNSCGFNIFHTSQVYLSTYMCSIPPVPSVTFCCTSVTTATSLYLKITALHCTALHCIALYYMALHYIALHCTALDTHKVKFSSPKAKVSMENVRWKALHGTTHYTTLHSNVH